MAYPLETVTFRAPLLGTKTVPLAEAWEFFEREHYRYHPESATYRNADGKVCTTFAKGFFVWDATMKCHRLTRIGLGAYGYGGPTNPSLPEHVRPTMRLIAGEWQTGINW